MPFNNVPLAPLELKYHTDPGHGWIEIKWSLLAALDILKEISSYSYLHAENAYLEEDCDAGVLFDALKSRNIEYKITRLYQENSPIRNYRRYRS